MNPEQIDIHSQRWPWCKIKYAHTHTDTLEGTYVNGQKAGPMWEMKEQKK